METLLLMAKSAKGVAASKLIEQALSTKGLYVYAELLDQPNIAALDGTQYASHLTLLKIFSYGTYADYKQNQASLPPLTPAQLDKLRLLTIVTLAKQSRILAYASLQSQLDIPSIRALEDLIIDGIYSSLLRGKLDQKYQQFEIEYTAGRDLGPGQVEHLLGALRDWSNRTSSVLTALDAQIAKIETDAQTSKQTAQQLKDYKLALVTDIRQTQSQNQNQNQNQNQSQTNKPGGNETTGGGASSSRSQRKGNEDEHMMEVDGESVQRKKQPQASSTSGVSGILGVLGGGSRKRVRGGA